MWRLLCPRRVVIQCISRECDIAMQCNNDQMVYCIFFLALCHRKAVLLREMMHRHIRSDACAQNQFFLEAFLFWSVLEIFGSSKNTQNCLRALWKFSDSENDFRKFRKCTEAFWHFRKFQKCFSEVPKIALTSIFFLDLEFSEVPKIALTSIFSQIWNFRKFRKKFSEVPKITFIALQRADLCCGYKYPPPLTCEGYWFHSNYLCPWLALSLYFIWALLPWFISPPVFDSDLVCVWVWIRVCVGASCGLCEDLWALASSPGVLCIIFYSWRLRTPRRLGVTPEPPIYLWLAGRSLWRPDLASAREEIPLSGKSSA